MANGLINEGLTLMLVGMGTVFVFLTVLVAATTLMSRLVSRFQSGPDGGGSGEEVAAIAAAISAHRRK